MRVAFNARLLRADSLRGWNRYTVNLLAELPALDVELFLYSDQPLHESHLAWLPSKSYTVRVAPPMRYPRWEQHWLPRQCAADGVEILHCPFNFGLPWLSPCPRVLTLHDAIDQVYYTPLQPFSRRLAPGALQARFYHWAARSRAERVITVSEHARLDLVRHLRIAAGKVVVIPEAASAPFHQPISEQQRGSVRERHGLMRPYMFYVGGWERRKNIPFLLRAFAAAALPNVDLVLAGGKQAEQADMRRVANPLKISDRLRLRGWVPDADLPALYAEALCFVYPSEYEGFGLQLCEAMAAGCPTLAARSTSLPEVLGDGGATFGLRDTGELSDLLRRLASDPAYRQELSARARKRALAFTWRQTASSTLDVYRRLLRRKVA